MSAKLAEGKYFWNGVFNPYKNKAEDHLARGMAEIVWSEELKRYLVRVITMIAPSKAPDRLITAIVFEGAIASKEANQVREGDILNLAHKERIGVGYAESTSMSLVNPSASVFNYTYPITNVTYDSDGLLTSMDVQLDVGVTKGKISFVRAE